MTPRSNAVRVKPWNGYPPGFPPAAVASGPMFSPAIGVPDSAVSVPVLMRAVTLSVMGNPGLSCLSARSIWWPSPGSDG